MSSLPLLNAFDADAPALADDLSDGWITYGELAEQARACAARLNSARGLVFLYASNEIQSVAALIGAMAAGHAVALLDPGMTVAARETLESVYAPDWLIEPAQKRWERNQDLRPVLSPHPDLAVLLSTSGSTGTPKFVRLAQSALVANAAGIAEVLDVRADDTAAGYLPIHYSYGLSVLTSHLARGARVRLTSRSLTDREFWSVMRSADVTHFPGVPFHHKVLLRLGLSRLGLGGLRVLTQAGGGLATELRRQLHEQISALGGRFYVLYGQTEAAPRMTTLDHDAFDPAPDSVGTPLPGCRIEIVDPDETGAGEVVFHGPNVMMGYAENRADLQRGDEMGGRLPTGDVGRLDDAGRLTLTGRIKRFGKLYGLRINLDEVEGLTGALADTAVSQLEDALMIHFRSTGDPDGDQALQQALLSALTGRYNIPLVGYRFHAVPAIPRTERGKVDYVMLEALP